MSALPAIFIDRDLVYKADACEPLSMAASRGELGLHMWSRGAYPGNRLPEQSLSEVCTIGVWDAAREQDWGLDWHRNEGLEITYLDQGSLEFGVDDREYELSPGNLTVTRPWQKHRVGRPKVGASRLYWLILDVGVRRPHTPWTWPDWLVLAPEDLSLLTEHLRGNEHPVWRANREIGACFRAWWDVLKEGNQGPLESRLKVRINELLLHLLELVKRSEAPLNASLTTSQRTVKYFLAELPKHLSHPWDLASMAKQCGMARSQFALHCRRITNRSPMGYLADCRIEAAKAMLIKDRKRSVTDIAGECGFHTSQYFATQFRSKTGRSPVEFRKQAMA